MASRSCQYNAKEFSVSYELVNPSVEKSILILHGWGSNKEIMKQAFGSKFSEYRHIYVDMPGFGNSDNSEILHTADYANIMQIFLDELGVQPEIIMGHSFGGKVATLLNPNSLVLLSSSGILVPKSAKVRAKIALFKFLKPIGFGKLRSLFASDDVKGMSHEMYETFKNVVDEDFESNYDKVTGKTLCFWGKSDTATPLWTGEKISSLIKDSRLFPLEGDHFFFLNHAEYIEEKIKEFC